MCLPGRILPCVLVLTAVGLVGCVEPEPEPTVLPQQRVSPDPMTAVDTLIAAPDDYARVRIGSDQWPLLPYAKYLAGVRVCLDPGHGGDAHRRGYKRGPTGVREAEINLRVARYLRDLLEAAGAEVLLTRDGDVAVSLAERAERANRWGADLFISCHHNAIGKPRVNRSSVWHHRGVDYRPSNLDLARYLCFGLMHAFQFPQLTGDSLKSDQLMYKSGFGVLRAADVTAALCESSFFTHPEEEQRLRTPEHNLLEAYGLFDGLARYAYAGLPRLRLVDPADGHVDPAVHATLTVALDDGLRARGAWGGRRQMILTSSIAVRLDDKPVPHTFRNKGYRLTIRLPEDLEPGGHLVEVQFINKFKNSVLDPRVWIDVIGTRVQFDELRLGPDVVQDPFLRHRLGEIDRSLCADLGLTVEQRACGVIDLTRGRVAMIRPDAAFHGAGVASVGVLLAIFARQADAGSGLDAADRSALARMIKLGDDHITQRFLDMLGISAVQNVLSADEQSFYDQRRGGIWFRADLENSAERSDGLPQSVTVRQCLRFYLMLAQGRLLSPEASEAMRAIFASPDLPHEQTGFVAGLAGSGATILRRRGVNEDWHLDTALVEHGNAHYVLAGLTRHPEGGAYLEGLAAAIDRELTPEGGEPVSDLGQRDRPAVGAAPRRLSSRPGVDMMGPSS
jgi:N-acetylmuramoyl-L-alanine amidase